MSNHELIKFKKIVSLFTIKLCNYLFLELHLILLAYVQRFKVRGIVEFFLEIKQDLRINNGVCPARPAPTCVVLCACLVVAMTYQIDSSAGRVAERRRLLRLPAGVHRPGRGGRLHQPRRPRHRRPGPHGATAHGQTRGIATCWWAAHTHTHTHTR